MKNSEKKMDVIYQWFEKQVTFRPHAIAIRHGGQAISYHMLNTYANKFASRLQMLGVQPDTLVALCLSRSSTQLIAILGILIAGGAYVPFDPIHQSTRIIKLLDTNQISLIITTNEHAERFAQAQVNILYIEDLLQLSSQEFPSLSLSSPAVEPHHLAYLVQTSGSTGIPKGVLIEQQSVLNYCRWFQKYTNLKHGCIVDYSSNYIFDMAVTTMLLPLLYGCTVVICDDEIKQNPRAYLHYLKTQKIQLIKLTPSYLKILLQELHEHPIKLINLSTIILGGENLSTTDCQEWLERYPHHVLFNEYGPSETTVGVMQYQITINNVNQYYPNIPIGKPGPNIESFILDSTLHPVADGEIGELYLGGKCLSRGYHQQPVLTAEKFVTYSPSSQSAKRLYKTGDLCRKNKEGVFEYFGRIDRQIKIRGYRVELGEIEHWLKQHPMIQDAFITLSDNQSGDQTLFAYCKVSPSMTLPNYVKMRRYLLNFLPHYMIPSAFITLEKFPLTNNGKLDEKALPRPQLDFTASKQNPTTKLERQLMQIWTDELELEHVGVHDNFYALGGHSLHAARIVSAILKKTGKELSLAEFYQTETIAALAAILKHRKKQSFVFLKKHEELQRECLKKKRFYERLPLSDFQLLLWIAKTFEPKASQLNLVSRKRIRGVLHQSVLEQALMAVLKRHEILSQRISVFYPAYIRQHTHNLPLNVTDLTHLSLDDGEPILLKSIQELMQIYPWPKKHPLIMLKIFYLSEDTIELHLCIPHLIADEISLSIFWHDLSYYYLAFCNQPLKTLPEQVKKIMPAKSFHDYIKLEQQNISISFEQDCQFWHTYLQNSGLFIFPETAIVRHMKPRHLAYSTYFKFPPSLLCALQIYCTQHHVGIEDILCVAVDTTLRTFLASQDQIGVINIVKSTRQDNIYDETIGCFLRIDPIKIGANKEGASLLELSKKIRQNILKKTQFYQASTILKLAFLVGKNSQSRKNLVLKYLISLYGLFLNRLNLNYKALPLNSYFSSFKRDNRFIIYMNLWQNFISSPPNNEYLGLPCQTTPMLFHDLSSWDNLCDISFLRDEHQNQPYVVVSTNLLPQVRERIAKMICTTLFSMIEEKTISI